MKSIDNVINKLKEKSAKTFRNITLLTGISLASLITGCENKPMINPLGPSINSQVYATQGTLFSGDELKFTKEILEEPYDESMLKVAYARPGESAKEVSFAKSDSHKYEITESSTPFYGTYQCDSTVKEVNMNEAQSDSALQQIIAPLVKTGSTTDGDIIDARYNFTQGRNGRVYNDDVNLIIYDSGSFRYYVLDVCGSPSDTLSSQKKTDADAVSVSCENVGAFSSTASLEAVIDGLQSAGWTKTF